MTIFNHNIKASLVSAMLFLTLMLLSGKNAVPAANSCLSEYNRLSTQHAEVVSQHPEDSDAYFRAMHAIEDALFVVFKDCPQNALLFTLMGEVQISLGNVQLANLYAKKAYDWNDNIWQTNHLLGSTLAMQDNYKEGMAYLEKAAALANDKPELLFNLCSSYLAAKNYKNVIKTCGKLITRKDHKLHGPAFHIRAQAHEALKMPQKARQDFKNAKILGYE